MILDLIKNGEISGKIAKTLFETLLDQDEDVDTLIDKQGLKQVTDSSQIEALVDKIIADNPTQVADYRSGKDKLFGFFVGQVLKLSQGKANPQVVTGLIKKQLGA